LAADESGLYRVRTKVTAGIPADRQANILSRIKAVASRGERGDVQRLAGSDLFRLRVGDYRLLFTVDTINQLVTVELVRTRGDVYKR
jgi:mRNA-degrading endonuclease RelE of RelBE toxin-antitoxin system